MQTALLWGRANENAILIGTLIGTPLPQLMFAQPPKYGFEL